MSSWVLTPTIMPARSSRRADVVHHSAYMSHASPSNFPMPAVSKTEETQAAHQPKPGEGTVAHAAMTRATEVPP